MAVVALISCSKSKQEYGCAAKDLYAKSNLFRASYELAEIVADKIFILSAKHGLVGEHDYLEPYDETLNTKNGDQIMKWARGVTEDLARGANLQKDHFVILAGRNYYEQLLPHIDNYWLPLDNLRLFERTKKLNELISIERSKNKAYILHMLLNELPRYNWQSIKDIPFNNGIYFMFESNEKYLGMDRITRVGSHQSQGRLKERLKDHFFRENKDGSIFRKNIGRSILNNKKSPYLDIWNLNTSTSGQKQKYANLINQQLQDKLERTTSDYLRDKFTFTCVPVENKDERMRLEEGIIASLAGEDSFRPGSNWFGLNSPIHEIATSGLWNVQGLDSGLLSDFELGKIKSIVRFYVKGSGSLTNQVVYHRISGPKRPEIAAEHAKPVSSSDIRSYIKGKKQEGKAKNEPYIDLVSGEIHNTLGMKNRRPQVCNVMYQSMGPNDEILHTTPSGYSSTIKIRYYLD